MFWTSTQLMTAAQLNKWDLWYLRKRFPNRLVPALVAGNQFLWEPATVMVIRILRNELSARGRPRKSATRHAEIQSE